MALASTARLIHPSMVSKKPRVPRPPPLQLHHTQRPLATTLTSSFALHSVDISKDDNPLEATTESKQEEAAPSPEEDDAPKLDSRRFEKKFAVLNTGIQECRSCGYQAREREPERGIKVWKERWRAWRARILG